MNRPDWCANAVIQSGARFRSLLFALREERRCWSLCRSGCRSGRTSRCRTPWRIPIGNSGYSDKRSDRCRSPIHWCSSSCRGRKFFLKIRGNTGRRHRILGWCGIVRRCPACRLPGGRRRWPRSLSELGEKFILSTWAGDTLPHLAKSKDAIASVRAFGDSHASSSQAPARSRFACLLVRSLHGSSPIARTGPRT